MLVDTHAHLQWHSLLSDIEGVVQRAREAGVTRVLTLGTEPASCRAAIALAEAHPGVYAAVGLHPGDVKGDVESAWREIEALIAHERVVAIGETGLDYYYTDGPPRERQIDSFIWHLELAARTGKPLCIHNREATDDVMNLLERYSGRVTPVLHCYTGDLETARRALDMGAYISFAGNITYPKLRGLAEVAAEIPSDRLLAETDSPFLAPQPLRGRRNEPAHIAHTYDVVASARASSRADLGRLVTDNAQRLFGWPGVPALGQGEAA